MSLYLLNLRYFSNIIYYGIFINFYMFSIFLKLLNIRFVSHLFLASLSLNNQTVFLNIFPLKNTSLVLIILRSDSLCSFINNLPFLIHRKQIWILLVKLCHEFMDLLSFDFYPLQSFLMFSSFFLQSNVLLFMISF